MLETLPDKNFQLNGQKQHFGPEKLAPHEENHLFQKMIEVLNLLVEEVFDYSNPGDFHKKTLLEKALSRMKLGYKNKVH